MKFTILPIMILVSVSYQAIFIPDVMARSADVTMKAFFGPSKTACYHRRYSKKHLHKQPRQQIAEVILDLNKNPKEEGNFNHTVYVKLRKRGWHSAHGFCLPNTSGFQCQIMDDGGNFSIRKKGKGQGAKLLMTNHGFDVEPDNAPVDAPPADIRHYITPKPSDKTFLLTGKNNKTCLRRIKRGAIKQNSAHRPEEYKFSFVLPWKGGGAFTFKLNQDQNVRMQLKNRVLAVLVEGKNKNSGEAIPELYDAVVISDGENYKAGLVYFNGEGEDDEKNEYRKFILTAQDYNFDGFTDFAIVVSEGYGGVNVLSDVYLYDKKTEYFIRSMRDLSNIKLNSKTKELSTSMKSGPRHEMEIYRFKGPKPWLQRQTTWFAPDAEYIITRRPDGTVKSSRVIDTSAKKNTPLMRSIAVKKARLFDAPRGAGETSMYLIKGDKVRILEYGDTSDGSWVRVRFKGKRRIEKWVRFEDVAWE